MGEDLTYGEDNEENHQEVDNDAMEPAVTSEVAPKVGSAQSIGDDEEIAEVPRTGMIHVSICYDCVY